MAKPSKIKAQPRPIRLYTYVTAEEEERIKEAADLADLKVSVFLRHIALAQQIRPARSRQVKELVTVFSKLGADLNRVGNNLNQLAHQANAAGYDDKRIHYEHTLTEVKTAVGEIIEAIREV
ncbi:plasmid mobilization relaxosome protein MobC [Kordiimonas sp. SCSIO 12603]|uniref:plasmid mobilization protein n=1 Tax=Kordiimonas sp. SCSIO 12603 TaxID=2829596 RepID=UPI002105B7FE|nr:plasmid mobilization relaxosome protein MobC [Kordiimonas sp. SCSIO 12603]UTW59524.1 plasmid mobilization relaxosome protein MobC [Kordiimonas sp. SCSIO 12603]